MGTILDVGRRGQVADLVRRARRIHVPPGWHDVALARAEAVVPDSPEALAQALSEAELSQSVASLPGGHDAVRRWLVLTIAANLDCEQGATALIEH